MKACFLDNRGCRYPFESLSAIPLQPSYFTERYLDVKKVLVETFFGPSTVGVFSPSVQSTLYQMAKTVLNRFRLSRLSLSPDSTCTSNLFEIIQKLIFLSSFCRFPDISSIQLKMPNIHFLPVNIPSKDNPAIVEVKLPSNYPVMCCAIILMTCIQYYIRNSQEQSMSKWMRKHFKYFRLRFLSSGRNEFNGQT